MLRTLVANLTDCPPEPAQPAGTAREAAVLVALTREPDTRVVLIQRAAHLSRHGGEVGFPGGMWDVGDPDLRHTALRETEEEIALPAREIELVARLERQVTRTAVQVTPYVGLIDPTRPLRADPAELDAVFRVPLAYLLERRHFERRTFVLAGGARELPCCPFDGHVIWGFTLMVLTKLLNRTLGAGLELDYGDVGLPANEGAIR